MVRKISAIVVAMVILVSVFAGCGKASKENLRGDVDSRNPLRICIDLNVEDYRAVDDFEVSLKETGGLENIVFDIIPSVGIERDTAIQRIRTEMMAGGGPDVFITSGGYDIGEHRLLFPFPEKVMESGLFLPLDEYMENNTEFTEWEKQQPVVLAAGRNEEGQQIIPLSYTFPVQTCLEQDYVFEPRDGAISWQDTLTDPELSSVYAVFNDCASYEEIKVDGEMQYEIWSKQYLPYILGKLADFEQEALLFTEEELLQRVEEISELRETNDYEEESVFTDDFFSRDVANATIPTTMMPLYSDDGGVVVTITNYAAVNRNTRYPEEAYRVIDVLLREVSQMNKPIYVDSICNYGYGGIPLSDQVYHKDAPFNGVHYFSDETFENFTNLKKQITAADFQSSLQYDISSVIWSCEVAEEEGSTKEEVVHEMYEQMQRKVRE